MSTEGTDALTWAGLLAQWLDFARAAVALPTDADGRSWRSSVATIVKLQAVTFALADLHRLPPADRALGREKAELLIDGSRRELEAIWAPQEMPATVREICNDAETALAAAGERGITELIWPGPGTMVMPATAVPEPIGTLAAMQPGTIVMPGEPVAWWADRPVLGVPGCVPRPAREPRQVYRLIDESGAMTGDRIASLDEPPPQGMPLLVPLLEDGRPIGHFTMDAGEWESRQRCAMVMGELRVE